MEVKIAVVVSRSDQGLVDCGSVQSYFDRILAYDRWGANNDDTTIGMDSSHKQHVLL